MVCGVQSMSRCGAQQGGRGRGSVVRSTACSQFLSLTATLLTISLELCLLGTDGSRRFGHEVPPTAWGRTNVVTPTSESKTFGTLRPALSEPLFTR
mmetsp:Transcript_7502/g.22128  ORF Transcript_7502/g.22128 Transcript_7502/m.22128 type:complete len:96 (+) Transcript_7502:27-314(+)